MVLILSRLLRNWHRIKNWERM